MKKILCLVALLLSSMICRADGWTDPLTVASATTENSDMIMINTTGALTYASGCVANNWIFQADSDARRGRVWATLLTALATGQKIRLWYNSSTCAAWGYHGTTAIALVAP